VVRALLTAQVMEAQKNGQSRREFCANACNAATVVVAGTWLSACGGSPTSPSGDSVSTTCTHEGCTVTGFDNPQFVCPCHGSRYTTSGSVANGPASQPLRQFASQVAAGVLSFTV
jgi:Rieske Fe-S protein